MHRTACTQLLHCRPAALPAAFTLTPTLSLVRYERRVSILPTPAYYLLLTAHYLLLTTHYVQVREEGEHPGGAEEGHLRWRVAGAALAPPPTLHPPYTHPTPSWGRGLIILGGAHPLPPRRNTVSLSPSLPPPAGSCRGRLCIRCLVCKAVRTQPQPH